MAGQNILYIYDAVGIKLRKTVNGITTDYAGNYVYENSVLQFFNTAEGYVEPNGTGWQYVYQYKDHLGNVRLSYADSNGDGVISPSSGGGQGEAEIREENNYYPFGLKHKGYNSTQNGRDHKYGFGNKEEQDELSLAWLDFGARNYDPALGRWMNLDPLAEAMRRHSPYNYAFDNPVYFIDADGMLPTTVDRGEEYQKQKFDEANEKRDNRKDNPTSTYSLTYELVNDEENIHKLTFTKVTERQAKRRTILNNGSAVKTESETEILSISNIIKASDSGSFVTDTEFSIEKIKSTIVTGINGETTQISSSNSILKSDVDLTDNPQLQVSTKNLIGILNLNPDFNPFNEDADVLGALPFLASLLGESFETVGKSLKNVARKVLTIEAAEYIGNIYRNNADHSGRKIIYKLNLDGSAKKL